jgi:hypothetical protein
MTSVNRPDVAARLRGLLHIEDYGALAPTAARLGVSESALRASVDDRDPQPDFEVLMAVVRKFAVEPTRLVTGQYDPVLHRQSLKDAALTARIIADAVASPSARPRHAAER